jgi:hypothetical protein
MPSHRLHLAVWLAAFCFPILAVAQQPPAFAFPTPNLAGTFTNLLQDRIEITVDGDAVTLIGNLGTSELRGEGKRTGDGFTGNAKFTGERVPCVGKVSGERLSLRIADTEWWLWPTVTPDPTLADLGAPELDPKREWTIAIYLGGDNDLEAAAVADLLEMKKAMPETGIEVVALLDRWRNDGDAADDWTDARVLHIRPGNDESFPTLGQSVERDMGSAATLAGFVAGVFRRYPARHHAVFLWDHGGGWTGICTDEDPAGGTGRSLLDLGEIRNGLRSGMLAGGVGKLDLIGFDACLMAQLEVALAVHDLADIMVASEAVVPGTGLPYASVLPAFAGSVDPVRVATEIVNAYGSFSDQAAQSGSTFSAFVLREAPTVAKQLDAVAKAALAAAPTQWAAIARSLFYAEGYEVRVERVADGGIASIDLLDLTARLRGLPGIDESLLAALQRSARAMVFARYLGAERTLSQGIAIYGPHRAGQYDPAYDQSPLGLANAWRPLLADLHRRAADDLGDLAVDRFRQLDALGKPSTTAKPFGGDRLLFDVTGDTVVEVQVHDWQFEADTNRWVLRRQSLVVDPLWPARWATAAAADMIDLVMPQFRSGKNELFHEIAGLTFAISDGQVQTFGTLDMSAPSTQAPIIANARYTAAAGGEPVLVQVAFDRSEWHAVSVRPIEKPAAGAVARMLVPVMGDRFEFLQQVRGADGEDALVAAPALTWGEEGLLLLASADVPGRYRAEMVARTLGGQIAKGAHEYELAANPDLDAWPQSWADLEPKDLVGTWHQFKVIGPQQYQDLALTSVVAATTASNIFTAATSGGPPDDPIELADFWTFEWRGLPSMRLIQPTDDGRKFGWYGPARVDKKDGKLVLVMKAVNASGVIWEWRQQ